MDSRGLSHVELQQPTEPVSDADAPLRGRRRTGEEGDDVVEALMIPLGVVVLEGCPHPPAFRGRASPKLVLGSARPSGARRTVRARPAREWGRQVGAARVGFVAPPTAFAPAWFLLRQRRAEQVASS